MEKVLWWHGCRETNRLWIRFRAATLALELGRPKFSIGLSVNDDWERTLAGDFCGFYWHLDWYPIRKLLPISDGSFSFYWHEAALWLAFWGDDYCSSSKDPWWRKTHVLHFLDVIFGKQEYSSVNIQKFEHVVIPMPEANYLATMTFSESTRKRPRLKAVKQQWTDIDIEGEAPKFPGKGENSWDCGDDGIYGTSVKGHSIPKAIAYYVQRVAEMREKRQGISALCQTK